MNLLKLKIARIVEILFYESLALLSFSCFRGRPWNGYAIATYSFADQRRICEDVLNPFRETQKVSNIVELPDQLMMGGLERPRKRARCQISRNACRRAT